MLGGMVEQLRRGKPQKEVLTANHGRSLVNFLGPAENVLYCVCEFLYDTNPFSTE